MLDERNFSKYLSNHEIEVLVQSLADRNNKDYKGKNLLLVAVLKGTIIFAADLIIFQMKIFTLTLLISINMFSLFGQGNKSPVDKEFKKISYKIYPVIKIKNSASNNSGIGLKELDQPIFKKLMATCFVFMGLIEVPILN